MAVFEGRNARVFLDGVEVGVLRGYTATDSPLVYWEPPRAKRAARRERRRKRACLAPRGRNEAWRRHKAAYYQPFDFKFELTFFAEKEWKHEYCAGPRLDLPPDTQI